MKKIKAENCQNLVKMVNSEIQEAQQTQASKTQRR